MTTETKPRKRSKADKSTMDAYADFMRRAVRAFGRKAAAGDVAALPELLKIQSQLDDAIVDAVGSLVSAPWNYSWQQVTDSLNADRVARGEKPLTRQAVQQRYAPKLAAKGIRPGRQVGGQPASLR